MNLCWIMENVSNNNTDGKTYVLPSGFCILGENQKITILWLKNKYYWVVFYSVCFICVLL